MVLLHILALERKLWLMRTETGYSLSVVHALFFMKSYRHIYPPALSLVYVAGL